MNRFLSVATYNAVEAQALDTVPNRIIEACRPELFLKAGYPVEVKSETGLARFTDVMQENRDEPDYRDLLGGLTPEEFEIFKEITVKVAEFTKSAFGRPVLPKGALTRAMLSFRHIRWLVDPGAAIFEIGPGSGYLGALLAMAGYRYGGSDITQGFYLYQSHLWRYLFGDRLVELADDDRSFTGWGDLAPGAVVHAPWWKYTVADAENIDTPVDLFVANHALCEMNYYSMRYTMRLSHQMLSKSRENGYFFVEGAGGETLRSRESTFYYFQESKFSRVFGDPCLIDIFVPAHLNARFITPVAAQQPSSAPPKPTPESSAQTPPVGAAIKGRRGLAIIRRKIANNGGAVGSLKKLAVLLTQGNIVKSAHAVVDGVGMAQPSETRVYRRIMDGRQAIGSAQKIPFDEVRRFQRALVPGGDVSSDDERFFQYVFGADFYS